MPVKNAIGRTDTEIQEPKIERQIVDGSAEPEQTLDLVDLSGRTTCID